MRPRKARPATRTCSISTAGRISPCRAGPGRSPPRRGGRIGAATAAIGPGRWAPATTSRSPAFPIPRSGSATSTPTCPACRVRKPGSGRRWGWGFSDPSPRRRGTPQSNTLWGPRSPGSQDDRSRLSPRDPALRRDDVGQLGTLTRASWPSPWGSWSIVWTRVPRLTTAVWGSPATERAPRAARSAWATWRRLFSTALRGCGPPNRAWSAWARGSVPLWSGSPGRGGVKAKSGGTTRGALRATANSSGRARLNGPPLAQPAMLAAAARPSTRWGVRMSGFLLLRPAIAHQERSDKQKQHADGNRRIAEIEDQKRPPHAEMEVGEIDDVAEPHPIEDVAERAAEHQSEGERIVAPLQHLRS